MSLRDYQNRAVESIVSDFEDHNSLLLVAATGSGKTVIYADVVRRHVQKHGGKVLILAPMFELLEQGYEALRNFGGFKRSEIGYESGKYRLDKHVPRIVLATIDTLRGGRIEKLNPDHFGLLIIDEADYATPATWDIRRTFPYAKALGVTATTKRTDRLALVGGGLYDSVTDVIEIRELIEEGWLVPIEQNYIASESIVLTGVSISKATGDFQESELDDLLKSEGPVLEIAQTTIQESGNRPTLIFCTGIEHSERIAAAINKLRPGSAASVSGQDTDREFIIDRFRSGGIQFLCNCMLLTRGVDLPFVSHLVIARPTKSVSLYTQMVGRGTRLHGRDYVESTINGKSELLVTDIVGVSYEHKLITAAHILGVENGETIDKILAERREAAGTGATLRLNILDITREAEEIQRRERLALELTAKGAKYKKSKVDPFDVLGVSRPDNYSISATDRQRETLLKFGLKDSQVMDIDRRQASRLIDSLISGIKSGTATYKQREMLARYGVIEPGEEISFKLAGELITLIAGNGWNLRGVEFEVAARIG